MRSLATYYMLHSLFFYILIILPYTATTFALIFNYFIIKSVYNSINRDIIFIFFRIAKYIKGNSKKVFYYNFIGKIVLLFTNSNNFL